LRVAGCCYILTAGPTPTAVERREKFVVSIEPFKFLFVKERKMETPPDILEKIKEAKEKTPKS